MDPNTNEKLQFEIKYDTLSYVALMEAMTNALLFDAFAKASKRLNDGEELVETSGQYSFPTRFFGGDSKRLDELKVTVHLQLEKQPEKRFDQGQIAVWDVIRQLGNYFVSSYKRTVVITKEEHESGFRTGKGDIEVESTGAIYTLSAKATLRLDTCKTDAKLRERKTNPPTFFGLLKPD